MHLHHPILLVDDDIDDQLIISKAFAAVRKTEQVRYFSAGDELLHFLSDLQPGQKPALIVLDYNIPNLNGREILSRIRGMDGLSDVPVVVFTTTVSDQIKNECTELGVIACLQKGKSYEKIVEQVRFFNELIADDVDTLLGN